MAENLERLYQDAKAALKAKNFDRASDLLRQILLIDENYQDTSRLLAQAVRLRRRRWYTDSRLWGAVAIAGLVLIGIWLAPRLQGLYSSPNIQPTVSPSTTITATKTEIPTETITPAPTSIPLTWKRIYIGQEFARDSITAIVVDPKDRDVIYAGTTHAGVYKSIDGGNSWQPIHKGLGRASISQLVFDPSDSGILYASTQGSLYRTINGGASWQELAHGREFQVHEYGTFIVVDPQNSLRLYYGTANRVYRSMDGGMSWEFAKPGEYCPEWIFGTFAGHITKSGVLYSSQWAENNECWAECWAGLYRSTDGGGTWKFIGLKDKALIDQIAVGLDVQGNEVLYVTRYIDEGHNDQELLVSHNGGEDWRTVLNSEDTSLGTLLVDPDQPTIVYAGRYKSEDGGYIWNITATFPPHEMTAMAVQNGGETILAGTVSGLFISTDGGKTWMERNNGLASTLVDLTVDPTDSSTFYAQLIVDQWLSDIVYRSTDGGQNWNPLQRGHGLAIDGNGGIYQVIGTNGNNIRYSNDKGETWKTYNVSPDEVTGLGTNDAVPGIVAVTTIRDRGEMLFSPDNRTTGKMLLSPDYGDTWQQSYVGGMGLQHSLDKVRFFFDPREGKTGYMIPFLGAFRTTDGGKTWKGCGRIEWTPLTPSIMTIDPRDSNRLMLAVRGEGIYRSEDGCRSWQKSNNGLGSLFVNGIAINPNNPDTLYAGTDSGAYVSFNSGETWNEINDGLLGATVVYSIVVDKDNNVYAATPYGIFKLEKK